MKFLILIGNAAVGKTTVGQELTKITDFKLLHGHMILEPVLEIYGERNMDVEHKIRDIIFDDFSKSGHYGLIFTYMMGFDAQECWDYLEHICEPFKKAGAEIYFVELVASLEARLQRNVTEDRLRMKPSKRNTDWTTQKIFETDKAYRCVSNEGEVTFENYIKIDNTDLAADVVASMIKDTFCLQGGTPCKANAFQPPY